jgi:hypothetical protein
MKAYITTKEEIEVWLAGMDGEPNPHPADKGLVAIYEDAIAHALEWAHERAWHQKNAHKL